MIKRNIQLTYTPDDAESGDYNSLTILVLDNGLLVSSESKLIKVPMSVVNEIVNVLNERKVSNV